MMESTQAQQLNKQPLGQFKDLFNTLESPVISEMNGRFQAEFVGPGWLRAVAPPGLAPLGLGGWQGKTFDGRGGGLNVVRRKGKLQEIIPIVLQETVSMVNGRCICPAPRQQQRHHRPPTHGRIRRGFEPAGCRFQ